jgi:hypothetical protein
VQRKAGPEITHCEGVLGSIVSTTGQEHTFQASTVNFLCYIAITGHHIVAWVAVGSIRRSSGIYQQPTEAALLD